MSEENKISEYDPKILHLPSATDGPIADVKALLNWTLKLETNDERTFIGEFIAFDKFGNFVLSDATEYFRDQTRQMNMVVVPLSFVKSIFKKPPQKKPEISDEKNEKKQE